MDKRTLSRLMMAAIAQHFQGMGARAAMPEYKANEWMGDRCDLFLIDSEYRGVEIEIKTSWADWLNDKRKAKWVSAPIEFAGVQLGQTPVSRFYFATPQGMPTRNGLTEPEWTKGLGAGRIIVDLDQGNQAKVVRIVRPATINPAARQLSVADVQRMHERAYHRYWVSIATSKPDHKAMLERPL